MLRPGDADAANLWRTLHQSGVQIAWADLLASQMWQIGAMLGADLTVDPDDPALEFMRERQRTFRPPAGRRRDN